MSVVIEARNRGGLPLSVILGEILPAALAVMLLATVGIIHVTSRVLVVAQGYELSRLDSIDPLPHDVPMDIVITEAGVFPAPSPR